MKKAVGGPGACSPGIFLKIYITVVDILVLFEQFLSKFCLNFLPLNLSVSPNIMHFVRTFSIMRAMGVRLIVIEMVQSYGKTVFIKNMFENGWWGNASPTPPWIRPRLH